MSLSKRTTVLFSPDLYARLAREAERRRTSVGHLVREACARAYQVDPEADRVAAVEALAELSLPVGTPSDMKAESVPAPGDLLP